MLIAFEGIDGSGKATQAGKLRDAVGAKLFAPPGERPRWADDFNGVSLFSFPRYTETMFGPHIKKYLSGGFGGLNDNHPFLISLLYALDRFEARDKLLTALTDRNEERVVICDRYVPSNVAHQCGKLPAGKERDELQRMIERTEYRLLGLPIPSRVYYLDLTAEQSWERTHARDDEPDLHQDAKGYLASVREVYLEAARTRWNWHLINCFDGERERSVEEIHEEIWDEAQDHLDLAHL
jgi:dTMP kinase